MDRTSPQEDQRQLVTTIIERIKKDKEAHEPAFEQMRRDMRIVRRGAAKDWPLENYTANITARHVLRKTAALYAKNPKATARRRESMDFAVWDEDPTTLQAALTLQQQAQAMQAQAMQTGMGMGPPQIPGLDHAVAVLQDFQQGKERQKTFERIGRTLELLFSYFMAEQKPLDFKTGMKQLVRRAITTGVGYVELGFQRETGPRLGLDAQLADARARLDHLAALATTTSGDEWSSTEAEIEELKLAVQALEAEPEIVLREGLVVDFPLSTQVIPDKRCKSLVGFVGARRLTIEYLYSVDEVKALYGVDLSAGGSLGARNFTPHRDVGERVLWDDEGGDATPRGDDDLVCVWKHYDKMTGLVYHVADGHPDFLRQPAAPEVFVETFWPVFALTFNAMESEDHLFPPSDVALMLDMQTDVNQSRQALREAREAARPRWTAALGTITDGDKAMLAELPPFGIGFVNVPPDRKLSDILDRVPVPGVDPNLYETGPFFSDLQVVVGTQEALMGGVSKATATETAIAANATTTADGSSVDDLDCFLSSVARASGQILLKEMSEEQVTAIAGPGAIWPDTSVTDIASELYLEVAAGSTGRPNQAVEIHNLERLMPYLLQIPGINPTFLARTALQRMGDNIQISDALSPDTLSIVAINQMTGASGQQGAGNPDTDPAQQGGHGGGNAPLPPGGSGGSGPAYGSNQGDSPI